MRLDAFAFTQLKVDELAPEAKAVSTHCYLETLQAQALTRIEATLSNRSDDYWGTPLYVHDRIDSVRTKPG